MNLYFIETHNNYNIIAHVIRLAKRERSRTRCGSAKFDMLRRI